MRNLHRLRWMGLMWLVAFTGTVAQTVPADLNLVTVTTAITAPIAIRAPSDNSGRVFVASQAGTLRIVKNGVLLSTPFLTIPVSYVAGAESGILSFEFHPNFGQAGLPHNDEFYVGYILPTNDPRLGAKPDNVLVRYTASANPDIANSAGTVVLRLADNADYHSSLDLHFGPDGYLYMAVGDGGTQNGVHGFAECLWKKAADNNPASCGTSAATYFMMGKILRLDVDTRDTVASAD
ncbi:MAG: PQQ-dependent sugar dehydrogenase, partial [Dokdonella sp.]